MVCPACNHANAPTTSYCTACGTPLALSCPVCNQPLRDGQKFCGECGTRIAAPNPAPHVPPAERKRVTILFADLVNSTALVENMDAEEVHELYNGALQRMSQAVTEMGGTIGALMGDGMMAIFGAPVAHEDDPERAARAGLAIIEAMRHYTPRSGNPLQVRVGINTGRVMMGEMGGYGRTVYTAVGDVVNLAARLESAATPNTVLVGESTWQHLAHRFAGEPLGTLPVKGLKKPVAVFRLHIPKSINDDGRGLASQGLRAPLIGRDREVATLTAQLNALAQPAAVGGVTFILGDAGIGKSRFVSEISRTATQGELLWLEGRSLSYSVSQPYAPWARLLRQWLGAESESDDIALMARLREALVEMMGDESMAHLPFLASLLALRRAATVQLGQAGALDPEARQMRVRISTLHWLSKLAAQQPLVVVFEDVHWSDPSSLALLEQAFDLTTTLPIRFLVVTRPADAEGIMAVRERTHSRLAEQTREIWLTPLDVAESNDLITTLLHWENAPAGFLEKIRSHADGNPFFVEEIIRMVVGERLLEPQGEGWRLTRALDTITLPPTIEALLNARIDRLAPSEKEILQRAAVVGRVFWRKMLGGMPTIPPDFNEALYQLSRQDFIRPRGWSERWETEYNFRHVLTQEAAYRSLPRARRRAYHREAARTMEQLVGVDSHDYDGVLAQHWEAAGDAEVAMGYYERAARHAAERFANAEATAYYERALALLPATDKVHRFDLLEAQQHLLESLGHTEQRQAVLDELLALAETWHDGARLARVRAYRYSSAIYMGAGLSLPQGEDESLIIALQQAGEQELLLDLLELVATRSWWGYAFPFDRAKGLARQQQALATAEQMRDEYRTFINRALLAEMRDELPEAEVALQRALQFANQQGDLRKQWTVYHRLGRLSAGNNPHSAMPHHQQAMRRGRDMADTRLELISADNLGLMASSVGAYELAYDTWQRALELLTLRGHSAIEHAFGINKVAFALLRSGRMTDAAALAEQATRLALDSKDEMILLQTRLLQAEIATLLGDLEQAGALYRTMGAVDAPDLAALEHLQGFEVYFASDVGTWYARQGDWSRAERFLTVAVEGFSTLAPHPMRDDDEVALLSLARLLEVYHAQGNHRAMHTLLAQAERALVSYRGREWSLVLLHAAQAQGHLMLGDAATAATWQRRARLLVERHATTFRHPDWQAQFLALHAPILAYA